MREQNTPAKSLLGSMTAVRGAVPAQGQRHEAHAAPFVQSHTHHFSPAPPARAENIGFSRHSSAQVTSPPKRYRPPYSAELGQDQRTS